MSDFDGFGSANDYKEPGFSVLPKGCYLASIVHCEPRPTKKGDGKYFLFEFELLEPADYAGRKLFARYNFENPSKEAEEIGRREMAQLLRAIGVETPRDRTDVLGGQALLDVIIEQRKDTGAETNRVVAAHRPGGGKKPLIDAPSRNVTRVDPPPPRPTYDDNIPF